MKNRFTVLLMQILFFTSCEKDVSDESLTLSKAEITSGSGGGGNSGGSFNGSINNQSTCKTCIYYPVYSGSVYNDSDTSAGLSASVANNYALIYTKDTTIEF